MQQHHVARRVSSKGQLSAKAHQAVSRVKKSKSGSIKSSELPPQLMSRLRNLGHSGAIVLRRTGLAQLPIPSSSIELFCSVGILQTDPTSALYDFAALFASPSSIPNIPSAGSSVSGFNKQSEPAYLDSQNPISNTRRLRIGPLSALTATSGSQLFRLARISTVSLGSTWNSAFTVEVGKRHCRMSKTRRGSI